MVARNKRFDRMDVLRAEIPQFLNSRKLIERHPRNGTTDPIAAGIWDYDPRKELEKLEREDAGEAAAGSRRAPSPVAVEGAN